jgi:hypothetical protein
VLLKFESVEGWQVLIMIACCVYFGPCVFMLHLRQIMMTNKQLLLNATRHPFKRGAG